MYTKPSTKSSKACGDDWTDDEWYCYHIGTWYPPCK